jgi:hypothetical protein
MRLLDLPADLIVAIATQLAEDDELVAALACRRLHQAIAGTKRRAVSARLLTTIGSAFCSVGKLEWAVVFCGLPVRGMLLLRAAGRAAGAAELAARARLRMGTVQGRSGDGKDPCSSAAAGGHPAVLQWARANGCPWDEYTGT